MRIAVFSDVHGNLTALDTVLAHIETEEVDEIVFAGDLCMFGPRPAECLRRVAESGIVALYGNTDEWLIGRALPPPRFDEIVAWTKSQLEPTAESWLASLPISKSYSLPSNTGACLHITHANPQDVNQVIFPSEADQLERYGRIRQPDDNLQPLLEGLDCDTLAFGHLHIPNVRLWKGLALVNVSFVSLSGNGDPRANYVIFDEEKGRWQYHFHQVPYDIAREIVAYQTKQPPGWQIDMAELETHGFLSQNV